MPLPTPHTNFFSSLKQVEKRLKSEIPPQESTYTSSQSLSPPIYLHCDQQPNTTSTSTSTSTSTLQDSETPRAFLSNSPDFPPPHEDSPPSDGPYDPEPANGVEDDEVDDIQQLIQLLGLSEWIQEEQKNIGLGPRSGGGGDSCCCEGGFYSRIVGVKGPKCGKEVERLEGWVKHFSNGGEEERIEPLRLAHLLLGKALFDSENSDGGGGGGDGGFWGIDFPSTIEEFLHNDPPSH